MTLLFRTGERIGAMTGWRGMLIAFAAGAASATGFAPLDCFALLLAGYAAIGIRRRARQAAELQQEIDAISGVSPREE